MKGAQSWELWELVEHLAAHGEDAQDHNLALMDWYAVEPLVPTDFDRSAKLAVASKIPLLTEFIARRLAMTSDEPKAVAAAVSILENAQTNETRQRALAGILTGFAGKRSVAIPRNWQTASEKLGSSGDASIRQQTTTLATIFGDPRALETLRRTAQDSSVESTDRQVALEALIGAADPKLAPILQKLVSDSKVSATAVRGLAGYNDPQTPKVLLDAYPHLDAATKLAALNTLAARRPWAEALTDAIDAGTLPRKDLTSPTVRNLSGLDDKRVNDWIARNWGSVKATDAEKKLQIARYRKLIASQPLDKADAENGRTVFARTCMQCHTLFGAGAQIGPDITGSNRSNPDYLLENIVDPSAVIGKDYLMTTIQTRDGRLIDGIIKSETNDTLTIASVNETLTLPKTEVLKRRTSDVSMMPEGLLAGMTDREVRDLIKYLGGPSSSIQRTK
jgi:putative heme-binding domain-containing protein